jgi:hypothetical protein
MKNVSALVISPRSSRVSVVDSVDVKAGGSKAASSRRRA